jgi:hypothetical protein
VCASSVVCVCVCVCLTLDCRCKGRRKRTRDVNLRVKYANTCLCLAIRFAQSTFVLFVLRRRMTTTAGHTTRQVVATTSARQLSLLCQSSMFSRVCFFKTCNTIQNHSDGASFAIVVVVDAQTSDRRRCHVIIVGDSTKRRYSRYCFVCSIRR